MKELLTAIICAALLVVSGQQKQEAVGVDPSQANEPKKVIPDPPASVCQCKECECRDELISRIEQLELQIQENQTSAGATVESGYQLYVFTADWCGPCRTSKAAIDSLGWEHSYDGEKDVWYVDADQFPETLRQFGVTSLPSFVLVERETKRVVRRSVGGVGAESLSAMYPEMGNQ